MPGLIVRDTWQPAWQGVWQIRRLKQDQYGIFNEFEKKGRCYLLCTVLICLCMLAANQKTGIMSLWPIRGAIEGAIHAMLEVRGLIMGQCQQHLNSSARPNHRRSKCKTASSRPPATSSKISIWFSILLEIISWFWFIALPNTFVTLRLSSKLFLSIF